MFYLCMSVCHGFRTGFRFPSAGSIISTSLRPMQHTKIGLSGHAAILALLASGASAEAADEARRIAANIAKMLVPVQGSDPRRPPCERRNELPSPHLSPRQDGR
jgi:hypothetical protein